MTCAVRRMPLRRGAQSMIRRLSVVSAALLSAMMGPAPERPGQGWKCLLRSGWAATPAHQIRKGRRPGAVTGRKMGRLHARRQPGVRRAAGCDRARRRTSCGGLASMAAGGTVLPRPRIPPPRQGPTQFAGSATSEFNSDGRYIFFLAPKSATSAALHRFDTRTMTPAFVDGRHRLIVLSGYKKNRDSLGWRRPGIS